MALVVSRAQFSSLKKCKQDLKSIFLTVPIQGVVQRYICELKIKQRAHCQGPGRENELAGFSLHRDSFSAMTPQHDVLKLQGQQHLWNLGNVADFKNVSKCCPHYPTQGTSLPGHTVAKPFLSYSVLSCTSECSSTLQLIILAWLLWCLQSNLRMLI